VKDVQPLPDGLASVESVESYTRMGLQAMPGHREAGEPIAHECARTERMSFGRVEERARGISFWLAARQFFERLHFLRVGIEIAFVRHEERGKVDPERVGDVVDTKCIKYVCV
jgi:hypothetical protein